MGIFQLFILSLFIALTPAFSWADETALSSSPQMSVPSQQATPSQSDLEKLLNKPAPAIAGDQVAPMNEFVARAPSHLPANMQNALIHAEEQKLAMYQQNLGSLEDIRRSDIAAYADAKDQVQKDSSLEAKKITDQKIAFMSDQIRKSQARLAKLKAGPMTAEDVRDLALLY